MDANCTCTNHGWHGEGHSDYCAVSVISALESRIGELEERQIRLIKCLGDNVQAWEGEEESVKDEHRDLICETHELIEEFEVDDGNLSYKTLEEKVNLLRESVEDARKELEAQATYFGSHLDPENNLFRILRKLEATLEATKEPVA